MPYRIEDHSICLDCPHSKCIIYIREQSKRMKDRDTQYRIVQKAAMACAFDSWIPGFSLKSSSMASFEEIINQCVSNADEAGKYIEINQHDHFGDVEKSFFLTSGQKGKVRGDIFETISRAILWNISIALSGGHVAGLPSHIKEQIKNKNFNEKIAALTLGDN